MRPLLEIHREKDAAERLAMGLPPRRPGWADPRGKTGRPTITAQIDALAAELKADRKSRRLALIRKAAAGA